jgi:hypothetical protein
MQVDVNEVVDGLVMEIANLKKELVLKDAQYKALQRQIPVDEPTEQAE